MTASALEAPAKLNLCLYLGPVRDDGLHEIASIFEPLELSDPITVTELDPGAPDEIVCEAVDGPNLAERALEALRARGWRSPPLRIEIDKRVPVAAGLGGGSADAAAVLRLARGELEGLRELAAGIGADVPSQIQPRPCLVSGAGEVVTPIAAPARHGVVLVPGQQGLATADVYAEADRLGLPRSATELDAIRRELRDATAAGASPFSYADLLVNDLEPAALSLQPGIGAALEALRGAGAQRVFVAGSGPTSVGLFSDPAEAQAVADAIRGEHPAALATAPLQAGAGV